MERSILAEPMAAMRTKLPFAIAANASIERQNFG